MNYDIEWKPKPLKYLNGLQNNIALRIWKKVETIRQNPFRYLEHYEGQNSYKLRIGNYRALIEVDFDNKKLIVRILDKRGRIYKK